VRFDKLKDPAALAAKDPSRYAIQGVAVVHRDGGAFLAATDGRALTLVRATLDDTDTPNGVYPVAAFAAARKGATRKPDATVSLNGTARVETDGAATDFAKVDGTFPDLQGVVPTGEPERVLRLNADYLARIQRALGADAVEIRMHDDNRDRLPLVIVPIYTDGGTDDGSFGVLMPIGGGEA
jgi:DNA polymerase III sliding clamp (beta) subunit (PCNA family)